MTKCERCGSEIIIDEVKEKFKYSICKDIKIERKFLKTLLKKVRQNFIKLREDYSFLKNLYLFGSYAEKELKCCDIDLLIILNDDLLNKFLKNKLLIQRKEIWERLESDIRFLLS